MNKETIEFLDQLSQKLGATGAALWAIVLRGIYIDGIISLITSAVCAALMVGIVATVWRLNKAEWFQDDEFPQFAVIAVSIVSLLVLSIFAGFNFYAGLNEALNPQYAALMSLIRH